MTVPSAAFRKTLIDLELVSNGTISSYQPIGRFGAGGRDPVTGDDNPPHLHYRDEWSSARTDEQRRRVEQDAADELKRLTRRLAPLKGFREITLKEQVLEHPGHPAELVARKFGCLDRQVRQIRRDAGLDGDLGETPLVPVDRRFALAHVMRLAAKGWGPREIERETGVPNQTVSHWLRNAA